MPESIDLALSRWIFLVLLKIIIEVFLHFTCSDFLSCGNLFLFHFHINFYIGTNQIFSGVPTLSHISL